MVCPILTNQGSSSTFFLVAPLHHWQRLIADSSASFSASRPTFGYEGLQVPRLDSKVLFFFSLGSGLQHLKFEEIQTWSLRCVFFCFFFQPSPAIWQVLLKFSYFTLTHRWEVHGSGQIIATPHDLTPNGGLVREIPLFQGLEGLVKYYNLTIWIRGFHKTWLGGKHFPRFPTLVRPLSLRYKAANPVLQWTAPGHRSKKTHQTSMDGNFREWDRYLRRLDGNFRSLVSTIFSKAQV